MLDREAFKQVVREALEEVIEETVDKSLRRHLTTNQVPPVLTRKQLMELLNIGESKCAELFHREDFPVCRETGHPRVRTEQLFKWMDHHSAEIPDNKKHQVVNPGFRSNVF